MTILAMRSARIVCMSLLLSCTMLLIACGDEGKEGKETKQTAKVAEKPTIALLIYDETDTHINLIANAIEKTVGDKAKLIVEFAEKDQLVQNEQIDRLIAQKVDGIMLNLVEPTRAAHVSEKAKQANIPIVFFNREPDVDVLKLYDNVCFVGTRAKDAGILQGDIIKQLWDTNLYDLNQDGIFQYIMIQADPDNVEALARTEYSIQQASKQLGVKLQQVGDTLMCGWDEKLAASSIRQVWPILGKEIELIISNNDTMALGAITALQENGYNKGKASKSPFIPVIGVDAIPRAIEAIAQGSMSATVTQNGALMATALVQLMFNAINDKDFLADTDWQWDDSGQAIRIPYTVCTNDK